VPLPEGLQFLKLGWWVIHVVAIYLVYQYAYRKGRHDARRERGATGEGQERKAAQKP
jgi:hypothetical protein